jgi:hypothetical protein
MPRDELLAAIKEFLAELSSSPSDSVTALPSSSVRVELGDRTGCRASPAAPETSDSAMPDASFH